MTKKPTKRIAPATPTGEAYAELQTAFDLFNRELFAGELPPCLITLNRHGPRVHGYFSHQRFKHMQLEDRATDEIALNPMQFKRSGVLEALQTLAHEMVHMWQYHKGKPSRRAYHDRQWAAKMIEIGLMPSHNSKPGGKTTGQSMGDYAIVGGRFAKVAAQLQKGKWRLSWYDKAGDAVATPAPTSAAGGASEGDGESEGEDAGTKSGKRVKFTCPKCKCNAWGKESLKLICGADLMPFEIA